MVLHQLRGMTLAVSNPCCNSLCPCCTLANDDGASREEEVGDGSRSRDPAQRRPLTPPESVPSRVFLKLANFDGKVRKFRATAIT